jgi:predicted permease
VGVLPPDFEIFYTQADVVIPLIHAQTEEQRSVRGLRVVARLADGATHESASADLKAIDRRIAATNPQPNRGTDVALIPLRDEEVGDIRPTMIALSVGAALVLLIACANVSNMLLARVTERNREIVTRAALGASSRRLARQFVTEALVLNALGAVAGVVLARWTIEAFAAYAPAELIRLSTVRMDWQVTGGAVALCVLTALFCSAGPVWRISRGTTITSAIARSTPPPEHDRARRLLVASQVALAVVALTGAALVATSFISLRGAALGFRPANVLTWRVAPPASRYADPLARSALYQRVLERLAAVPGIESAGAINILPITDADQSMPLTAAGSSATDPAHPAVAKFRAASPGYFETLAIPVLRGRAFKDIDVDAGAVVVSASLARLLWGADAEAVNRQVMVHLGQNRSATLTIVGVVGDVRQFRDAPPQPTVYASSLGQSAMTFVLRSPMAHESIVHTVRGVLTEVDGELAAYDIQPMNDRLEQAGPFTTGRFRAGIGVAFGIACLLLAVIGVHGVVRYAVAQQTREIGVRIAVGATAREIVRLVVVRHLVPVIAGLAFGLAGSVVTVRVLAGHLYGVSPSNPALLILVPSMLLVVAALAAWLPARRAAAVSPLVALRQD